MTDFYRTFATQEELMNFGAQFASELTAPSVIALSGCLGAGKTTLAKGIISALTGLPCDSIVSPTFQYVHLYEGKLPVAHFDLWRLQDLAEFLAMGLDDFLEVGVALVEWPDRIASILPEYTVRIELEVVGEGRLLRCRV